MKRNILLIEPNYKNKYPPIGLMKIATYHRNMGDNLVFYKGDLKEFIINQATELCIGKLIKIDKSINWLEKKSIIYQYIKTRKGSLIDDLDITDSQHYNLILGWLENYKNYYWKKEYIDSPIWDKVFVTTLFTFYWKITIETIEFAKTLVKNHDDIMVGGILATILHKEVKEATGIKPWRGLLNVPGVLDEGNTDIIDDLPLDYSILDEIDYEYPENNAYYGYMTRGCIRKCPFCAVPTLEPKFNRYIPIKNKIELTKQTYGEQRNLLLLDNNVLASKNFEDIISDIKDSGFYKGATYIEPNQLDIALSNLRKDFNSRAYIRKSFYLLQNLLDKTKGDTQTLVYNVLKQNSLLKLDTCTKDSMIKAYDVLKDLFESHRNKSPKLRYVDFNQGVDARLFAEEKVRLLSEIPIRPLRIAFDNLDVKEDYVKAIRLGAKYGIKDFSNYLLYNFKDTPEDLYERFRINIDLCDELNISIYSFPMKYHPLMGDFSENRDFIGEHWNRKFIRAVQAILNATKGKIGKGTSFFEKAFGRNIDEYMELLHMPETYILYRFFFESIGLTEQWRKEFNQLSPSHREKALHIIYDNDFNDVQSITKSKQVLSFLNHYTNYRKDIITQGTELYQLKQEYDKNPTIKLKRANNI
ncbi:MAG: hypothetical protein LBD80_05035 [Tannerella sp.]|jgi:hypothetical protein|nr:hypothetical protein [Tannerella sp.]